MVASVLASFKWSISQFQEATHFWDLRLLARLPARSCSVAGSLRHLDVAHRLCGHALRCKFASIVETVEIDFLKRLGMREHELQCCQTLVVKHAS